MQRRLLSERDLTLQKVYNLAHSLETASHRASELQASVKATTQVSKDIQQVAPGRPTNAGVFPPQCCYRCGKAGHHPNMCHYRLQKCRGCGKRGHIVRMCKTVEKGTFHGTARPVLHFMERGPLVEGDHITVLDMWAAHKSAPQNPTPMSLLVRNHLSQVNCLL